MQAIPKIFGVFCSPYAKNSPKSLIVFEQLIGRIECTVPKMANFEIKRPANLTFRLWKAKKLTI